MICLTYFFLWTGAELSKRMLQDIQSKVLDTITGEDCSSSVSRTAIYSGEVRRQ